MERRQSESDSVFDWSDDQPYRKAKINLTQCFYNLPPIESQSFLAQATKNTDIPYTAARTDSDIDIFSNHSQEQKSGTQFTIQPQLPSEQCPKSKKKNFNQHLISQVKSIFSTFLKIEQKNQISIQIQYLRFWLDRQDKRRQTLRKYLHSGCQDKKIAQDFQKTQSDHEEVIDRWRIAELKMYLRNVLCSKEEEMIRRAKNRLWKKDQQLKDKEFQEYVQRFMDNLKKGFITKRDEKRQ